MNKDDIIRGALYSVIEGRESIVFDKIKEEVDCFFEKYGAIKWLTLNQSAMIHAILMSADNKAIINRLGDFRQLQLKRTSEKDKWQKEVDGEKAIDYFYGMVHGLLDKYHPQINEELEKKFDLQIGKTHHPMIYQSLIRIFGYIFITHFRTSKEGKERCLKN